MNPEELITVADAGRCSHGLIGPARDCGRDRRKDQDERGRAAGQGRRFAGSPSPRFILTVSAKVPGATQEALAAAANQGQGRLPSVDAKCETWTRTRGPPRATVTLAWPTRPDFDSC
jgi:hypothetical protein